MNLVLGRLQTPGRKMTAQAPEPSGTQESALLWGGGRPSSIRVPPSRANNLSQFRWYWGIGTVRNLTDLTKIWRCAHIGKDWVSLAALLWDNAGVISLGSGGEKRRIDSDLECSGGLDVLLPLPTFPRVTHCSPHCSQGSLVLPVGRAPSADAALLPCEFPPQT